VAARWLRYIAADAAAACAASRLLHLPMRDDFTAAIYTAVYTHYYAAVDHIKAALRVYICTIYGRIEYQKLV